MSARMIPEFRAALISGNLTDGKLRHADETETSSSSSSFTTFSAEKYCSQNEETDGSWRMRLDAFYQSHRSEDENKLHSIYETVKRSSNESLLLVQGPSCTGKTTLANTLKQKVEQQGGYFLRGKFDVLRKPEPYTAFVSAFTEFSNLVSVRGNEALDHVRNAVNEALGDEVPALVEMIPSLTQIFGCQNGVCRKSKAKDAFRRFVFVFQGFLQAICSEKQPLVIFLDDLQYADKCSLDLLSCIVTEDKKENLVIVVTCQDDIPVKENCCYLASKICFVAREKNHQVKLNYLDEKTVRELIAAVFQLHGAHCDTFAKILYQHTAGNMFYTKNLFRWLIASDTLTYDSELKTWFWDEEEIKNVIRDRSGEELLFHAMQGVSPHVQEMLKVASCLGPHLNESLLEHVLGSRVKASIEFARKVGAIDCDEARGGYSFRHDEVQKTAYRLIPESEKVLFHLEVGRRMWRKFSSSELDEHIFTLLSQFKIGERLVTRKNERIAVATSCYHAGIKAAKSSTFRTASTYLELGIRMLGDSCWEENYDLSLLLHIAAAETDICSTNYEQLKEHFESVFQNAKNLIDKIPAYALKIYILGVTGHQREGIDLGIKVLKKLGVTFSNTLVLESFRVKLLLQGKSDEQILRLPHVSDEKKLAAIKILHSVLLNTITASPHQIPHIALKLMQLTLQYGLSTFASVAFTMYGQMCVCCNDVASGMRFGKLGLVLLEKFEAMEYLPRVYLNFYGCIYVWTRPALSVLDSLMQGYRVGVKTGDIDAAVHCASFFLLYSFYFGSSLYAIRDQLNRFNDIICSSSVDSSNLSIKPTLLFFEHLMDTSKHPSKKVDLGCFDEVLEDARSRKVDLSRDSLHLLRMLLYFTYKDYSSASQELAKVSMSDMMWPRLFFRLVIATDACLVCLACKREGIKPREHYRKAKFILRTMRTWLRSVTVPHVTFDLVLLLEAELASVQGRHRQAMEKFTCAIALFQKSSSGFFTALANERAGLHLFWTREKESAFPYFEEACRVYNEFGALGKCNHLRAEMDNLFHLKEE